MKDLIITSLGSLTEENIKYLLEQKILLRIDGEYEINGTHLEETNYKNVSIYSLYCAVLDQVTEENKGKKLNYRIGTMREKSLNIKYKGMQVIDKTKSGGKKNKADFSELE